MSEPIVRGFQVNSNGETAVFGSLLRKKERDVMPPRKKCLGLARV